MISQFSSVHDMSRVLEISPVFAFETVLMLVWLTVALSRPFKKERRALPLSLLLSSRRCDVLGFVPAGYRVPQHFISAKTQATCDGCFARQIARLFSVILLDSGIFRTAHPQESSNVAFRSKLTESVMMMMACLNVTSQCRGILAESILISLSIPRVWIRDLCCSAKAAGASAFFVSLARLENV